MKYGTENGEQILDQRARRIPFWWSLLLAGSGVMAALDSRVTAEDFGPVVVRLFWQDQSTDSLMWGEVHAGKKWVVTAAPVSGFPKLDSEKQNLGHMKHAEGMLLSGVQDSDDGKIQSGWVCVDTGVREEPHGDHSHWKYQGRPSVRSSLLDSNQGNPAHLYVSNNRFLLANDARNGFSQISPKDLAVKPPAECGVFRTGGGGHITLAPLDDRVCYATWIDREGPGKGRVDVVRLTNSGAESPACSFTLPTGGIHGAIANSGRVFFAPDDGICWVDADPELKKTSSDVTVNHISLGKDAESEKPFRTGAFVSQRNWVLFTTGPAANKSTLCLLDAAAASPKVIQLPVTVPDGLSLTAPEVVLASGGKRYAFLFQDKQEGEIEEKLTIVDLDPNGDRNFTDAAVAKTITVGPSKVDGHHGHHSISFDAYGRHACFTNPGDGTIWVMTLKDLEIRAKSRVGGTPDTILAVGAPEHKH